MKRLLIVTSAVAVTSGFLLIYTASNRLSQTVKPLTLDAVLESIQSTKTNAGQKINDVDSIVILSLVGLGYLDMALNLYETSFRRHNISNYIFAATDNLTCSKLQQEEQSEPVRCVHAFDDARSIVASDYASEDFERKCFLKLTLALRALRRNLTVLIVDLDVVFLRNPLPVIVVTCPECDIVAQLDKESTLSAGFYLARPTPNVLDVFDEALRILRKEPISDVVNEQNLLNRVIKASVARKALRLRYLSAKQFPVGRVFFDEGEVMYDGDSLFGDGTAVVVHNSWIVSKAAKIYRFKETGMWDVDTDRYYSNASAKYLSYDNPFVFGGEDVTLEREIEALQTALIIATLLDRIVILPTFHCRTNSDADRRCSMIAFFRMSTFDDNIGTRAYRQHQFLEHRKVPAAVRSSRSGLVAIASSNNATRTRLGLASYVDRTFVPKRPHLGPTVDEIAAWFGDGSELSRFAVLRFYSLYNEILPGSSLLSKLGRKYKSILERSLDALVRWNNVVSL